ncbi:MAG: DinB family protein [Acidobacteriota bacterium]
MSIDEIKKIRSQLRRSFSGVAWHGPAVQELLADVTAAMAVARPLYDSHTIWELVLHITTWENAVRRKLAGEPVKPTTQEDWPPIQDSSEAAWQQVLAKLESEHNQLLEAVSQLTVEDLEKIVAEEEYNVYFMLYGVIQHNIYHAGQISLLKKAIKKS